MRKPSLVIATIITTLLLTATAATANGATYPELSSPPQADWDGTDVRQRMEPPSGDQWFSGFGANANMPPITDFDTTMGSREQLIANEMLVALNNERSSRGLRTLTMDTAGVGYATALAHRNSAMDFLAHSDEGTGATSHYYFPNWVGPNDEDLGGFPQPTGENVGFHDGVTTSSGDQVRSYMASTWHRTSILGGDYDAVGIGVACQVIYNPSVDGYIGRMITTILPIRTQQLPNPQQDPSYSATPLGNPAPQGNIVTPADSGVSCFDYVDADGGHYGSQNTGGGNGGVTPPVTGNGSTCLIEGNTAAYNLNTDSAASIYRLYCSYFLRLPDHGGYDYWTDLHGGGLGLGHISDGFAGSQEFQNRYGQLDNVTFVDAMYANVMERSPDQEGWDYWTNLLNTGVLTRGQVVLAFSDSPEFRNRTHTN